MKKTCPFCGADMFGRTYVIYPDISVWCCPECGWETREKEQEVKKRSRADMVRSWDDEKLAEWAWSIETNGRAYGPWGKSAWLKWLQEKVE